MAQISKGDTFTNGEQVTGARLNQLVDSSTLLVGAITDQPSITANTLESTDSTIVNDSGVLKEATIGDILNSNLSITTSSITGGAGVDIIVTPAATKKFDIAGAFEADSINSVGNATIGGTLVITGSTTLTGGISGNFTLNGNVTIGAGKTLTLDSAPTTNLHAATKAYVDANNFVKAFAKNTGTTLDSQKNIASVTNPSVGTYTYTFTSALSSANYVVNVTNLASGTGWFGFVTTQSSTGFTINVGYINGDYGYTHPSNPTSVYVAIFGT